MAAKGSSSTPLGVILTSNEYKEYLHLTQAAKFTSISYVAQTGNACTRLSHSSRLWILNLERLIIFIDWSTRRMIGIGCESQGLFHFSSPSSSSVCASMDTSFLIQNRLSHQNISKFRKMVPHFSSLSSIECESCQFGKHTRVSFLGRLDQWTKSHFELVHTDVWGPSWTESTSGFLYFVIFINDYSRYTWIFLMKAQAELFSIF